ncbi:LolA family protein [Filimonas effusa]|uniref:Outer membrane lipoprotein-sorting protein n=1 Tax=Filimonas effusa TaxID=2508721 RepID=A0A4Q1D157_9BACT|nr:hypothetical protein [Filimonas effusa]RXK81469.1 hypothetical protein ESB13_21305 [Filimonas effusa]
MKNLLRLSVAAIAVTFLASFAPYSFDKLYAEMETRQLKAGKYVTIKGEVCYSSSGDMITHYSLPRNYVLVSNKQGEVKLYEPAANTVILSQNTMFSSQTSLFYYFLSGKAADMGLTEMGYVQDKVYRDKEMLVSEWRLKKPAKKELVQKIKLVHKDQNPVYMHYQDAGGAIIRKVYYYGYTTLDHISFPATSTDITFQGKDSSVSKTVFHNFKMNQQANSPYFNFQIPANAKIKRL